MNAQLDEVRQFAASLRRARRKGGEPSYRELAHQTGYSISSISRVLNGKVFPRWRFTELFLTSCKVDESQINGIWHRRWLKVTELLSPLGDDDQEDDEPGDVLSTATGQECQECGSLVINQIRHHAWHTTYMRRPDTRKNPRPALAG